MLLGSKSSQFYKGVHMKLAIMAFLISFGAFAQTCNLTYESGQLSWTAFKTPKKLCESV
jgi:hypothetical protein